jgi:hypothetical protein
LADLHERERAGVSGDPVPDREYGDGTDKCCVPDSDTWEEEIKEAVTSVVLRQGKVRPEMIASELLLHDTIYMVKGRTKKRLPTAVIVMYAREVDSLYETPDGEWVAGEP